MSTTSLKLPDDLKLRAAAVAAELGVTPHAFMVEAIRKAAVAAEKHAEFVAQSKAARKKMLKSGEGFDANEVHDYLRQRVRAAQTGHKKTSSANTAPKAKSWRA